MIKLAALAFVPVLAATFYVHPEMPEAKIVGSDHKVEAQDRAFLENLKADYQSAEKMERADREFLARLQVDEMPVMRAIAVERATPVTHTQVAPPVAVATTTEEMPEIRRAIPVAASRNDLRGKLNQSYTTMSETTAAQPEIRRATPVTQGRASIVILGNQVTITPRATTATASASRFQ